MSGRGYRRGGSYAAAPGPAPAVADRSGPDLTQLEEVTDEELLALLRQCSAGLLARIIRLCSAILRPRRMEIYCQLPCANPECPNACGRRVDPTRQRARTNHACRVCHRFGW